MERSATRDGFPGFHGQNAADIKAPTLLIAGDREHSQIHRSMALLEDVLPNSQRRLAPNAGNGWSAELPGLFAETVRAWCRDGPIRSELVSPPPAR
jgi:hypothetical protein